jgi:hypothetical protein
MRRTLLAIALTLALLATQSSCGHPTTASMHCGALPAVVDASAVACTTVMLEPGPASDDVVVTCLGHSVRGPARDVRLPTAGRWEIDVAPGASRVDRIAIVGPTDNLCGTCASIVEEGATVGETGISSIATAGQLVRVVADSAVLATDSLTITLCPPPMGI